MHQPRPTRQQANFDDWHVEHNNGVAIPTLDPATIVDADEIVERLRDYGVVVMRRRVYDLAIFERLCAELCDEFRDIGLRSPVENGDGLTTYVFPENITLLPHTEQTYKPCRPPHLCFFQCVVPPDELGGETTLVDGHTFLDALSTAIRGRFERHGITYEMRWSKERWSREFGVATPSELDAYLEPRRGVEYRIDRDVLHMRYTTTAITKSVFSGLESFAPNLLSHLPSVTHPSYRHQHTYSNPTNQVYFGDGAPIEQDVIHELIDIVGRIGTAHRWQAGDLLVVDNTRFLHGRRMTVRSTKRVMVSRFGLLRPTLQTRTR